MLIELFIAKRVNDAARSLKRVEHSDVDDIANEFGDRMWDWAERRALKRKLKKLNLSTDELERPARKPDSSKRNKK